MENKQYNKKTNKVIFIVFVFLMILILNAMMFQSECECISPLADPLNSDKGNFYCVEEGILYNQETYYRNEGWYNNEADVNLENQFPSFNAKLLNALRYICAQSDYSLIIEDGHESDYAQNLKR